MGKPRVLKPREIVSILEKPGFVEVRQRGPHRQYRHMDGRQTTIPFHPEELLQLVRDGYTVAKAARKIGVGKAAVSKRLKRLNVAINGNVVIRAAHKIVDREINALD